MLGGNTEIKEYREYLNNEITDLNNIITQEFRFYYKKWTDIFMGRCHKPDSHNGQARWTGTMTVPFFIVPVHYDCPVCI